jgi:hypothetical protein
VIFKEFQEQESNRILQYVLKVYVDDFMLLIIPATKEEMLHVAKTVMTGIDDVFPAAADGNNDPISLKKMKKGESQLSTRKMLLGFEFDGDKKMLWLKQEKKRNSFICFTNGYGQAVDAMLESRLTTSSW